MSKTKLYQGQSLFDKANEITGSVENAFEMAVLNAISITDSLEIGQELLTVPATNKTVVLFFSEKRPATGMKKPPIPPGLGIGYMRIGVNFKIG